jgi:hypothetical protein
MSVISKSITDALFDFHYSTHWEHHMHLQPFHPIPSCALIRAPTAQNA